MLHRHDINVDDVDDKIANLMKCCAVMMMLMMHGRESESQSIQLQKQMDLSLFAHRRDERF